MNTRNIRLNSTADINDMLTTTQIQEEVALTYLRQAGIEDLLESLDNLNIQTLDKLQNVCQAILQDRLLSKAHRINQDAQTESR